MSVRPPPNVNDERAFAEEEDVSFSVAIFLSWALKRDPRRCLMVFESDLCSSRAWIRDRVCWAASD